MILRRVITHFRRQEWTAIALDFLIVVVGVFIGIQVANWNEMQAQRSLETQILLRLKSDFELLAQTAEYQVEDVQELQRYSAMLVKASVSDEIDPDDKPDLLVALEESFDMTTVSSASPTYQEILASGQVLLIKDEQLRQALAEYASTNQLFQSAFAPLAQAFFDQISIIERHVKSDVALSEIPVSEDVPVTDYDWAALTSDEELAAALRFMLRLRRNEYQFHEAQQYQAEDVLLILNESISDLN